MIIFVLIPAKGFYKIIKGIILQKLEYFLAIYQTRFQSVSAARPLFDGKKSEVHGSPFE